MIQHPAPLNLLSKAHDHPLTQSHNLDIVRLLSVSESGLSSFSCFNVRPYPFPSSHSHPLLAHVGQRSIQHGIVEGKDRRPGGDVFDVGLGVEHRRTWHEALHEALHEVPSLCHHCAIIVPSLGVYVSQCTYRGSSTEATQEWNHPTTGRPKRQCSQEKSFQIDFPKCGWKK